eukprot:8876683-Alexandrium_andersonii.AAC.1
MPPGQVGAAVGRNAALGRLQAQVRERAEGGSRPSNAQSRPARQWALGRATSGERRRATCWIQNQ